MSAPLFLLVVENLATNIRKHAEGRGLGRGGGSGGRKYYLKIEVNGQNKVIQISQLADDTASFFANGEAIINGLKIVEEFGNVYGLKLNKDKTDGLWLGSGLNRNDGLTGTNWDKQTVRALGVNFGYDKKRY